MNDFGLLVGQYLATLPTLTDTQKHELVLDSSGRLIIAGRFLADTDSFSAGDSGISIMAVRKDTATALADTDGDYSPLQVDDEGYLRVAGKITVEAGDAEYLEDSAHSSGDAGLQVLAVRQDTLSASTDTDGDYSSFKVNNLGELYVKDADTLAQLVTIDGVLDNILLDTNSLVTDIGNIDTNITNLTKAEDDAHSSGDNGIMSLAVRADADGTLVDTDGDYAPLQVDADGKLKTAGDVTIVPVGSEAYTVTDALAAAGDGIETITAAATPWVTVASLAVTSGTAYVYGYQWACDQNAQVRLITDDGADVIVYKTDVNSSAQPGKSEHWSDGGRIEIAGAAGLNLNLQIKKRSSTGGDANGSGSLHVRTA